ncbi:sigma-70 family RNA polymerase sigma factor [Thermomicrobiaceae bacterium CFH 74404]|uniref:RNA polymerase sigma factor n=1 Tax=Thermalbibacter longus TaxID=2951981 RepID=A0AA41WDS9_9BACT|nr:sigma-70 family RNA polymerase sigma factor [Thermalbibacter longus]MCM8747606.1 sigma-70 family RNA polymerase sigma factor [Thermalbibacter longus]
MEGRDDRELLQAIARQDADALVALFDRYNRLAFGLAYRILGDAFVAEEVVQDAFMSIWRHAASYDLSRGTVRTWLLTIVRNRAIDQLRGRFGRSQSDVDLDTVAPLLAAPDEWDDLLSEIQASAVRAALRALPEEQRIAIELAYFEGLTHVEIAERLSIPLGTVKSRLRLGLQKLHDLLVTPGVRSESGASDGT